MGYCKYCNCTQLEYHCDVEESTSINGQWIIDNVLSYGLGRMLGFNVSSGSEPFTKTKKTYKEYYICKNCGHEQRWPSQNPTSNPEFKNYLESETYKKVADFLINEKHLEPQFVYPMRRLNNNLIMSICKTFKFDNSKLEDRRICNVVDAIDNTENKSNFTIQFF